MTTPSLGLLKPPIAHQILAEVARMRRCNELNQMLCWDAQELERLAMFAISAKNDLAAVDRRAVPALSEAEVSRVLRSDEVDAAFSTYMSANTDEQEKASAYALIRAVHAALHAPETPT